MCNTNNLAGWRHSLRVKNGSQGGTIRSFYISAVVCRWRRWPCNWHAIYLSLIRTYSCTFTRLLDKCSSSLIKCTAAVLLSHWICFVDPSLLCTYLLLLFFSIVTLSIKSLFEYQDWISMTNNHLKLHRLLKYYIVSVYAFNITNKQLYLSLVWDS